MLPSGSAKKARIAMVCRLHSAPRASRRKRGRLAPSSTRRGGDRLPEELLTAFAMRRGDTMSRTTCRPPTWVAKTPEPTRRAAATLVVALLFSLAASDVRANTQTQSAAGTCVDDNTGTIGTVAWTSPNNATTSDNAYATVTPGGNNVASHYLKCTGLSFSVHSTAVIQGIQVEWEYKNGSTGTIKDKAVRIVKGGTIGATDKASGSNWPATDTFTAYGSSADLWGDSWTGSDINSANFGAALSAQQSTNSGSPTASVDSVKITVTYTMCGVGRTDAGEQCDDGAVNGAAGSCCSATCTFKPNGTACSDDGHPCTTDTCDGSSNICQHPAGNAGTTCRASAGVCDVAETCTGTSSTCPADGFLSSSTVCRASAGVCDGAENCTGTSASCPADSFLSSSTVCRASAGVCDVAENCTGTSASCPANLFLPSSTVCRTSAGVCDVAENCTGTGANCPADGFLSSSTVCRAAVDVCDAAENCTGTSAACPPDALKPSSTVCRTAAADCDVAANCTGASTACPTDVLNATATPCTADGNPITDDV